MTDLGPHWAKDTARMLLLTEGHLDPFAAKSAVGLLRYRPQNVTAVIDSTNTGRDLMPILGCGQGVPIVDTIENTTQLGPTAMVIGVATSGGSMPMKWRTILADAIDRGLHIINGLHEPLGHDQEFATAARQRNVRIYDLRHMPIKNEIASARARKTEARRILTVGSDCNVGKMVVALELTRALRAIGRDARFIATGQTGMMIEGRGVCIDAVVSDFIAGVTESLVCAESSADDIVIEGQGSITHPGFSGVTLGLMHGALPEAMILVHPPQRTHCRRTDCLIPPLTDLIELHEAIMRPLHPAKVVAIALNCHDLDDRAARRAIDETQSVTQLPATDVLRFGIAPIMEALPPMSAA